MITQIANVKLPASERSTAELVPEVYRTRALSGRMITRYAYDKWKLVYELPKESFLELSYQSQIYAAVIGAMQTPVEVSFINPYTQEEMTVNARCTSMGVPNALALSNYAPRYYEGVSFTFEEV